MVQAKCGWMGRGWWLEFSYGVVLAGRCLFRFWAGLGRRLVVSWSGCGRDLVGAWSGLGRVSEGGWAGLEGGAGGALEWPWWGVVVAF